MIAVSDGELTDEDVSYIKNVYRKTFNKNIDDKEISKVADQVYSNPKVFLKDIKLYSNRIEPLMREHSSNSCMRLAAERKGVDSLSEIIKKLAKSLRIKAVFLDTEMMKLK